MSRCIGIVGGSGLYEIEGVEISGEEVVDTPFGSTSAPIVRGSLHGVQIAFLPRHGRGHVLNPSEIPYRANIYALKAIGADWVISVSAVGSLAETISPGHLVLPDQFLDRTQGRRGTFFDGGIVAHVPFGDPVCPTLRAYLRASCEAVGATAHDGGTYVCMEGPAFSTRAESEMYRRLGGTVIGMTNLPEAKLAREAELSYATLAMVTDYDCWHPDHDQVSVEQIMATARGNVRTARAVLADLVPRIGRHDGPPPMEGALRGCILTHPDHIPPRRREAMELLVGKYLS